MILRAYEKRKGVIGERRPPQDFDAALLMAPISPLEYRIVQLIAYRQYQFTGRDDPSASLFIEDFMALGAGSGRTAVFDALGHLDAVGIVVRSARGGGKGKAVRYAVEPNCDLWAFPETVHPRGRFEVVPYRERTGDSDDGTVRHSGPFQSATADPLAANRPPQRTKPSTTADPHKMDAPVQSNRSILEASSYEAHSPQQASGATSSSPPRHDRKGAEEELAVEDVWSPPAVTPPRKRAAR